MKFLYKIWTGYDGFTPSQISSRLSGGNELELGWMRYMDPAAIGDEVWVYFHGPGISSGVYLKGFIRTKDPVGHRVLLRVREYATGNPLTDQATNDRIAAVVARYGLQVFVFPEIWDTATDCNISTLASSCEGRLCGACATWKALPLIGAQDCLLPHRLPAFLDAYVPAFWVIPSRSYIYRDARTVSFMIQRTTQLFYRFKMGISKLAYPLALGIYKALERRPLLDFDRIIPIPLSPDKAQNGEIHRTLLLARELSRLLGVKVSESLHLASPMSKSILRVNLGLTPRQFEAQYSSALKIDDSLKSYTRVLLLDDVCTEGSTLRSAAVAIRGVNPKIHIAGATAGQMIVRAVVRNDAALFEHE